MGPGRCGSTLLCTLLDSLHEVRGLGEVSSLLRPAGPRNVRNCLQCGTAGCRWWPADLAEHRHDLYDVLGRRYPGARVLVDASKLPAEYRGLRAATIGYRLVGLILVKRPHELLVSYRHHVGRAWGPDEVAREWCYAVHGSLRSLAPNCCDAFHVLEYRDLAARWPAWRDRLAGILGVSSHARGRWWDSTTHMAGGNLAVHAALHPRRWDVERERPRYAGRLRQVFVDRPWVGDLVAQAAARRMYAGPFRDRLEDLLQVLGLGTIDDQLEDLAA